MKKCAKCGTEKPLTEFHSRILNADGRSSECKECFNGSMRNYYQRNKEKLQKYQREYYYKNKEKLLRQYRERYARKKAELAAKESK